METALFPEKVGVESDIVELVSSPPMARARFRIDNEGSRQPFPEGDWLQVRISVRLFDPEIAQQGRFDEPLAAGPEVDGVARARVWSSIDLPLPLVFRREYSLTAKVFSADPRYRHSFSPSHCRVVRATLGSLVRLQKDLLEDVYRRGGYGNAAAEAELKRWVRDGLVVVEEGGHLFRAREERGQLHYSSMAEG